MIQDLMIGGLKVVSGDHALEMSNISRRFGDVIALSDVSFRVDPGCIVGFVGVNGAGKTTAMRIIMGVERADAGVVRWGGAALDAGHRRRFGYMPEERGLYPKMRAIDQLIYLARLHGVGAEAARRAGSALLERFGLAERARDPIEDLSLGNQQRVQLAAALVHEPELLVLDEPFSGLDPVGVDTLAGVLRDAADVGTPILFSSHQLELVERLCDAVSIIHNGRLVASGTVAELRANNERRLRVAVRDGHHGWAQGIDGVEVLERHGDAFVLRLAPGVDDQVILDRARRSGAVTTFNEDTPTLAQRYREVVNG